MHRNRIRKTKPWTLASAISAGLIISATSAMTGLVFFTGTGPNYSTIPPKASEIHASLSAATLSLSDAVAKALNSVADGKAISAEAVSAGDTITAYEILVYSTSSAEKIIVNAESGEITESTTVPRFPGDPIEGEWTETDSGLKYYDLVVGEGDSPSSAAAKVEVHYTGWLIDGTKFDSSVDRGKSITFPLNQVIAGWTEGVQSMKIGGKRKLIIPSNLGYGPRGAGGSIPPNATLVFDVELLGIEE